MTGEAMLAVFGHAIASWKYLPGEFQMRIEQLANDMAVDLNLCPRCGISLGSYLECVDCKFEAEQKEVQP